MSSDRQPAALSETDPTRRLVLRGAVAVGALGVAGVGIAGCGGGEGEDTGAGGTTPTAAPESSTPGRSASGLASTSEVPVGGGKVFSAEKVVVTQPQRGTFAAFTAVCTHQGCTVNAVEGGTINCACHGSKYAIADGSVTNGPATQPLASKQVKVEGDQIIVT